MYTCFDPKTLHARLWYQSVGTFSTEINNTEIYLSINPQSVHGVNFIFFCPQRLLKMHYSISSIYLYNKSVCSELEQQRLLWLIPALDLFSYWAKSSSHRLVCVNIVHTYFYLCEDSQWQLVKFIISFRHCRDSAEGRDTRQNRACGIVPKAFKCPLNLL